MDSVNNENVLNILSMRERYGVRSPTSINFSSVKLNRRVHMKDLSIASAWSPKRLQNMILAIGPGTVASKLKMKTPNENHSTNSAQGEDNATEECDASSSGETDDLNSGQEDRQDADLLAGRKRTQHRNSIDDNNDIIDNDNANHAIHNEDEDASVEHDRISNDSATSCDSRISNLPANYKTSISHSGCINTAAWLDCPWRLSTAQTEENVLNSFVHSSSHSSNPMAFEDTNNDNNDFFRVHPSVECPTQIVTSGDDMMIKVWDCSRGMGSDSPVPCPTTRCPFAYSAADKHTLNSREYDDMHKAPGYVKCLASVRTGHRGNVFHVTPLHRQPGQVLTCAADGHLNLCNLELETISTVLALDGMCFSHQMLDSNIGLVCGEDGIRRFDLRVPRSSQPNSSLLGDGEMCKACAVYSAAEAESSSYVFAGGASQVALYDLRFLSDSANVVQQYRPSCFPDSSDVSVSGIDISKDRKELLVSYESDQIYTFPLFPSCADPTADDMLAHTNAFLENPESRSLYNSHFATYGGHLNRFTFLKCAKYAGPNDEYICTGSDSGHAFIYEKHSGSVVSLLKTDKSTCNGIVPHPTLPIFITYGIDSTAKMWRATIPVDDEDDDSKNGRRRKCHEQSYKKSVLASRWSDVRSNLAKMSADPDLKQDDAAIFPDELALRSVSIGGRLFDSLPEVFFRNLFETNPFNPGSKNTCNDLENLPEVLRSNYYEAVTAILDGDEIPVRCGLNELHRRIGLIRLCHQAHQLGISIDPEVPWDLQAAPETGDVSLSTGDLIPNCPADWLPYDTTFTEDPLMVGRALNREKFEDFYNLRYASKRIDQGTKTRIKGTDIDTGKDNDADAEFDASKAWDILHEIISSLKEEGNKALEQKSVHLAARLYDKALAYCSIAYVPFPQSNLDFLTSHQKLLSKNAWHCTRWSALFKSFISIRLNLSMALLKDSDILDTDTAHVQASLALFDLRPFTSAPGTVLFGRRLQNSRENEPIETFKAAKDLEAKAYFRLGSAKFQDGQYASAMHMFEKCLAATSEVHPERKPDKMLVRRLAESKRLFEKQRKKTRKKFKFAIEGDADEKPSNSE